MREEEAEIQREIGIIEKPRPRPVTGGFALRGELALAFWPAGVAVPILDYLNR